MTTSASRINNHAVIVGTYSNTGRHLDSHGFMLKDGEFTPFDLPGAAFWAKRPGPTVMNLEYEMTYRVRVRGPLPATTGSPRGERQYWEMAGGEITGARINAHFAMPGGDWYRSGMDGLGRPDVRVQFQTEDGAVVLLRYTGIVQPTEAFKQVAKQGGETRFEDQYMRMAMFFETGAAPYAWLNQALFVAEGRLIERDRVEYRVYRVA